MEQTEIKAIFFAEWNALMKRLNVEKKFSEKTGQLLFEYYQQPQRHHHTAEHIAELLYNSKNVKFNDYDTIILAIFFHDAIYELVPGRHSALDELDSALFAKEKMNEMGIRNDRIEKVVELILATVSHTISSDDDTNSFIDLDISVIASDFEHYERYRQAIRAEYTQIWPLEKYLEGRNKFLMNFAKRKNIFATERYSQQYDTIALRNIIYEINANQKELTLLQQKVGLYAGSFDPPTRGHMGIIAESALRLDKLIIGVGKNPAKDGKRMFTNDESVQLIKAAIDDFVKEISYKKSASATEKEAAARIKDGRCKIIVAAYDGLTIDFAIKHNATQLIRGIRPVGNDFAEEITLANANKELALNRKCAISTTFIPTPREEYMFISSGHIRLLAHEPQTIAKFIYPSTADAVNRFIALKNKQLVNDEKRPIIIGLTGSIGAGKSHINKLMQLHFNAKTYNADDIAKNLILTDTAVIKEITDKFPIIMENGAVNMESLKKLVYSDSNQMTTLERIIGSPVRKEIERIINEEKTKTNNPLVVIEVALLFEKQIEHLFNYTISVVTSPKIQIEQVMKRGKMSLEQIASIMKRQMPQEIKMAKADYTIFNDPEADLKHQLHNIIEDINNRRK